MFKQHFGNDLVKRGTYLSITTGEFASIGEEGGRLPGEASVRYLKVNPLLALFVGPIAGLLFVIFLPLAVPLFTLWLIAGRLGVRAPAALRQVFESTRRQSAQPVYAAMSVGATQGGHALDKNAEPGGDVFDELLVEIQQKGNRPPEEK